MTRNRQKKQIHSTRKVRNVRKTSQCFTSHSTDDKEFSETLSQVLDYFAINEHFIQFRRDIMLSFEHETTLTHKSFGHNRRTYVFGSQVEGTTTIGMMSDADILQRFDTFRLFLDSEDPPVHLPEHQVVIQVTTNGCASQYCVLTMIEPLTQALNHFQQLDPTGDTIDIDRFFRRDWMTTYGMITHTILFDTFNQYTVELKQAKRHGPAENIDNTDCVKACYCKSIPTQCNFVFQRPRPGHWPSEKTLKKAKTYGVFMVPHGPPKSTNICTNDYVEYQWRMSTNLTERLLMFSLSTVHLKAYVLTKMLRKELFVPEYRDRLSTFHFKTAFFFTVENTQPDVWREDNLINCVKYLLSTLRRFFTSRYCPHFTIENVNLFDGKIARHQFPKLVDKLTNIIKSLQIKIRNIQMDNIGKSLNECNTRTNGCNNYHLNDSAIFNYVCHIYKGAVPTDGLEFSDLLSVNDRITVFEKQFSLLEMYQRVPLDTYKKYNYGLHSFMSGLASLGASAYLEQEADGREYKHDGISKARQMFIQSLESNIISNYMRYASFLFCKGEYDEACKYFDLIEQQIEEDKQSNLIYQLCVSPTESLALQIANQSFEHCYKQSKSVFMIFRQAEAMCVPEFLRCEIDRDIYGIDTSSELPFSCNNNDYYIYVQIEPYLYYLQYLTYRLLRQEPERSEALMKLSIFTEIIKSTRFVSHFHTSLNMLGHCFELEQKLESARKTYNMSLQMQPQRNAAILHLIRLM